MYYSIVRVQYFTGLAGSATSFMFSDDLHAVQVHQSIRVFELVGAVQKDELLNLRKMLHTVTLTKKKSNTTKRKSRTTMLERSVVASLFQLVKFNWFPQGTKIQVCSLRC